MLGAIFGDIVGSVYEFNNAKRVDFPLLSKWSHPTDDSIMTLAVARALMNTWGRSDDEIRAELVRSMQALGRQYPHAGYGGRFAGWLHKNHPQPYNSFGNGSGMRVSSVGWLYQTLEDTLHAAELTAEVTHNHPEGIKGAKAIAASVFLARAGASKEDIRMYAANAFGYDVFRTLDEIRPGYHFDETCQGSVPEAIIAFYESEDYEDAIRKAVSLGGDSDTIACMAGAIAEAFYGMPNDLKKKALQILDPCCRKTVKDFKHFCHKHDRSIHKGWKEEIKQESKDESLENNWAIETILDGLYQKKENGETNFSLNPLFSVLLSCMQEEGHFLLPIEYESGLQMDPDSGNLFTEDVCKGYKGNQGYKGNHEDKGDQGDKGPGFVFKRVSDDEGEEVMPVFTSKGELEKAGVIPAISLSIERCMELALDTEDVSGMVINPYGKAFFMDKELMQRFVDLVRSGK